MIAPVLGTGDVIEVVGKGEVIAACGVLLQGFLDFSENLERDDAANSAAIQREKFSGTGFGELVFE